MVTIRSSTWNVITQTLSPLLLIFIGVSLKLGRSGWLLPLVWIGAGLALGFVAFYWLPIAASFDHEGITRRFLLRRQRISWDNVSAVIRTKSGFAFRRRGHDVDDHRVAPTDKHRRWESAGLAVVIAKGKELAVTERLETQDEYELIRTLTKKHAPEANWRASSPLSLLIRE
ncbi:MAG: hypothetical protein GEU71_18775 [Actinobacteria bacterium]|nr:hypothetical protein [Actinomycetota bacterium]